jgi:hypothetical protein
MSKEWIQMNRGTNTGRQTNGKAMKWQDIYKLGATKRKSKAAVAASLNDEVWLNDRYQASVRRRTGEGWFDETEECYNGFPEQNGEVVWLSIKRIDKEPIHDWRDLQRIKNDICGPESNAMEIYPAESRLMDTSNQYHLFAFQNPIPIGFVGRAVRTPEEAAEFGAKQREF